MKEFAKRGDINAIAYKIAKAYKDGKLKEKARVNEHSRHNVKKSVQNEKREKIQCEYKRFLRSAAEDGRASSVRFRCSKS